MPIEDNHYADSLKEPKIYGYCNDCGKPIYEGSDYYKINDDYNLCEDCIQKCWRIAGDD